MGGGEGAGGVVAAEVARAEGALREAEGEGEKARVEAEGLREEVGGLKAKVGGLEEELVKARDMRELVGGGGEGEEVSAVVMEELASAQGAVR